jgi:hypothetical protein
MPRKRSKEDATKEANSSNRLLTKFLEENYSNYFSRALNASRLIFL